MLVNFDGKKQDVGGSVAVERIVRNGTLFYCGQEIPLPTRNVMGYKVGIAWMIAGLLYLIGVSALSSIVVASLFATMAGKIICHSSEQQFRRKVALAEENWYSPDVQLAYKEACALAGGIPGSCDTEREEPSEGGSTISVHGQPPGF